MPYYAVTRGHRVGDFPTWDECRLQVSGYPAPVFRRFFRFHDAKEFLRRGLQSSISIRAIINSTLFQRGPEGKISIYTDGACTGNGTSEARAAIGVFFNENHPENISRCAPNRKTNNGAELEAIREAVRIAKRHQLKGVLIYTDSGFIVNSLCHWLRLWRSRNWRTSSGRPVIYKDERLLLAADPEVLDKQVKHVPGHLGVLGNECADQLAQKALSASAPPPTDI
ncbi:ribonuclease H1-like [Chelonus insularis]|uniref:ribonuclease H1-like n=1 Tax=Chelonus insularis TaxID=460826 RepID=UPI001589271E|nr:ribonuclease H1-like [Chelonus insularis]